MRSNVTVLAPASYAELRSMLRSALYDYSGPVAVRYPRGTEDASFTQDTSGAPDCVIREGTQFTLAGYGNLIGELLKAADLLAQEGISCEVVKLNQLIPLHAEQVVASVKKTHHLAVVEEVIEANSVGHAIATALAGQGVVAEHLILLSSGMEFVPHGSVDELRRLLGIDAQSIVNKVKEALG